MSPLFRTLGIDRLTVEERLRLANDIWESVEAEVDQLPLSDEQKAEIDRRIAASDADPSRLIPRELAEIEAAARLRT